MKKAIALILAVIMLTMLFPVSADNAKRDNIVISGYYITFAIDSDKQDGDFFKRLSDCGLDELELCYSHYYTHMGIAKLAYEYGIRSTTMDSEFFPNREDYLTYSNEDLAAVTSEVMSHYEDTDYMSGIYLKDEPRNANPYARIHNAVKAVSPESVVHLNFLAPAQYLSYEQAEYQYNDYLALTKDTDYLMFDYYPFMYPGSTTYKLLFSNYDTVRRSGLRYGVDTAAYIQSIGFGNETAGYIKREPSATDILYQDMVSLAYGMKKISYFKIDPIDSMGNEVFSLGIVDSDGMPTDTYYSVQAANKEVHALGKTLVNLDAMEVYLSGTKTYGQERVPSGFFVHSGTTDSLLFSYMRDRTSGRNYLMVVNNDLDKTVSVPLTFAKCIDTVSICDNDTGEFADCSANGLKLTLRPGAASLIALPEGYDYGGTPTAESEDLCYHCAVYGDSSIGEDGWYLSCLTDGYKLKKLTLGLSGWCSEKKDAPYNTEVTLDLGKAKDINTVTLYPAQGAEELFPKEYTLSVSSDGETWTQVGSSETKPFINAIHSFDTVNARYVKLSISDMNGVDGEYAAALGEIEVTNGGGVTDPFGFRFLRSSVYNWLMQLRTKVYDLLSGLFGFEALTDKYC